MITKRIIPCLDVKNGRVVKGTNFQGLSDVSDPVELGKFYSDNGADELVFYDITASFEGRKLFTDILQKVASSIFIPLTVGGGINSVDDFDRYCGKMVATTEILPSDSSARTGTAKRTRSRTNRSNLRMMKFLQRVVTLII